jgi:hypothetical protein
MDNTLPNAGRVGGAHSDAGTTQLAAVTGTPIGQVAEAAQPVHVTHTDGSSEDLGVGGQIYADDVIQTAPDGEVAITFVDGTQFSLGGGAEMKIDKLIYDPSGSDNALALNVLQGAFVFVTGGIAGSPGEGMSVSTPAGSIGVRGTSVGGHGGVGPDGWIVALLKDVDGHVGKVVVYNNAGEVVLDQVFESTRLSSFNTPPSTPEILSKPQIEALFGVPLEQLPDLLLQNDLGDQRGQLDDFQTAAGASGGGSENTGHSFGRLPPPGLLGDLQDHGAVNPTDLDVNADVLDLLRPQNALQFVNPFTPSWSISGENPSQVAEGDTAFYTIFYTNSALAPGQTATITVSTDSGNNAGTADAISGADYNTFSTVLTFTAGQTAQTVAVQTVDDTLVESTEDYGVQLSGQSSGTISAGTASTNIIDNDVLHWSITGPSTVTEGSDAIYTVSYSDAALLPGATATVTVQTNSGTATQDTD